MPKLDKKDITTVNEDDIEYQITLSFVNDGTIMLSSTTDNVLDQLNLIHIAYISILQSLSQDRPTRLS
jgi:hypothetical protein